MRTLLSIFFIGLLHGQEWPRMFKPGPAQGIYQELGEKDGLFHYRTKHYRIESDRALRPTQLKDFTRSAESVALVLERMPLPLSAPPTKELPRIRIFGSEEAYHDAGGGKGTAGFYSGRRQEVFILWSQLFLDRGGNSRLGPEANFPLIVHELAHLQMHGYLWRTPPWFYEGVAEYLAASHEKGGIFNFTKMDEKVRNRIKRQTDPEADKNPAMAMAKLVRLDSRNWHRLTDTKEPYEVLESYSSSLLLIHYFFNGDDERRAEVAKYLEEVQKVRDFREEMPELFTAEQANEIQKKLVKYWGPRGLKLQFR
ncbi:MAG: hypothetical protein QNK83_08115 [Akkermansiaceae bacterium]